MLLTFSSTITAQDLIIESNQKPIVSANSAIGGVNGIYGNYAWNNFDKVWNLRWKNRYEFDQNGNVTLLANVSIDSINYGEETNVTINTYDNNNNLLTILLKSLNPSKVLINNRMNIYTYDNKNRTIGRLVREWDTTTNNWYDKTRNTWVYDQYDNLYEEIYEQKTNNGLERFGYKKYIYQYNNGLMISKHTYRNDSLVITDTTAREYFFYDNIGRLTSRYSEQLDNNIQGKWRKLQKYDIVYGATDTPIQYTNYSSSGLIWRANKLYENLKYNKWSGDILDVAANDYKTVKESTWDFFDSTIIKPSSYTEKIITSAKGSYKKTYYLYQNNVIAKYSIDTLIIDEQGNKVLEESFRFNADSTLRLSKGYKTLYTYTSQNKFSDKILQIYATSPKIYINSERDLLLTTTNVSSEKNDNKLFVAYPNPSNTNFTIDILKPLKVKTTLKVYNLQSKLIQEHSLDINTTHFELNNLENGMYLIQIEDSIFKIIKY